MNHRVLIALPVFNEAVYVNEVLDQVSRYSDQIVVIDDGSVDGTSELLAARGDVEIVTHPENQGYGAALISAFEFAIERRADFVITIDCDGQHEPQRIPEFVASCKNADIVSGSRYLKSFIDDNPPPAQRKHINHLITAELNEQLSLHITDAFCGFKAYRVSSLKRLQLTEPGYAMPLELWVQAAAAGLRIAELPVPLIYLDEKRTFGGRLDEADVRLEYYRLVLERSLAALGDHQQVAFAERPCA